MNIIEEMAKLIVAKAKSMADIDGAEVNPFYLYSAHGFMTGGFERSFQLAQNWVENARSGQIPPELQPESAVSASDNKVPSSSVDGGSQTASLSAESGSDGVIPKSGLVIDATGTGDSNHRTTRIDH